MNINELEELAKEATPGPWIGAGPSFGAAMPKFINEVLVDRPGDEDDCYEICRAPMCLEDSVSNDLLYIAAAHPSAIIELVAAYREAVAALRHGWSPYYINGIDAKKMADEVFDTAKHLGVE